MNQQLRQSFKFQQTSIITPTRPSTTGPVDLSEFPDRPIQFI